MLLSPQHAQQIRPVILSLLDSRGAVVVQYVAAPYMESTSSKVEWKKGSAELLILSLVEARPRHGYEISKLIEQRSEGAVRFYVASLCPLLYRLEKRGWIQGRWVEKSGQRRRRYYLLTQQGKKVLASQRRSWQAFVEAVNRITEAENA
jgi:PadR family transcriptional regulator, regulatory protein PadR